MTDGAALKISQQFEVIYCCNCKIAFAVPADIRRRWLDDGSYFYCPNGHSQHYSENSVAKLEKQLASERKRREWAQQEAARQREQAEESERRRIAQKAATTRLRNRAKSGLCPCCNRHFNQLEAHMKNKHPEITFELD